MGETFHTGIFIYTLNHSYFIFFFISPGMEQVKICAWRQSEAQALCTREDHPHSTELQFSRGGKREQSKLYQGSFCGGRHRQLDLTIWVEFDWISFGTVSHSLNSSVNGVTILENYWGKTTLPLMLLS